MLLQSQPYILIQLFVHSIHLGSNLIEEMLVTHRNDCSYSGYNQIVLYLKDKIINTLANYEAYLSQFKILGNNL